jgi:hypothetical protein
MKNNDLTGAISTNNALIIGWLSGIIERGTDPKPTAPNPPPPPIKIEDLIKLRQILLNFQEDLKSHR